MTDENPETLPTYIRQAMDQRGLTSLRDVTKQTGVAHEAVRRILDGRIATPTEQTLKKLADGLGLSLTKLRELAGRPRGETTPFTLPREFDQLTMRQRRVLLEVGFALLEAAGKDAPVNSQG